jgi:hypothetical protein
MGGRISISIESRTTFRSSAEKTAKDPNAKALEDRVRKLKRFLGSRETLGSPRGSPSDLSSVPSSTRELRRRSRLIRQLAHFSSSRNGCEQLRLRASRPRIASVLRHGDPVAVSSQAVKKKKRSAIAVCYCVDFHNLILGIFFLLCPFCFCLQ